MATLHIVYDPSDQLRPATDEAARHLGLKSAILSLAEGEPVNIETTVEALSRLLLAELAKSGAL